MEYYIHQVPVFIVDSPPQNVIVPEFCDEAEEYVPTSLLDDVEVVYIGNFSDLGDRNAAYSNGAIYMTSNELTNLDMLENFIHEVAHALEPTYGWQIYAEDLKNEFLGKRRRLKDLLQAHGYHFNPLLYDFTEYSRKFDNFLANVVGYPTLLTLTLGLFISPYGATSLQEYFANGFEKYFLDSPQIVRDISPVLYGKIEDILNEHPQA